MFVNPDRWQADRSRSSCVEPVQSRRPDSSQPVSDRRVRVQDAQRTWEVALVVLAFGEYVPDLSARSNEVNQYLTVDVVTKATAL